jgi:uncharacterized delta-60 repeat protein
MYCLTVLADKKEAKIKVLIIILLFSFASTITAQNLEYNYLDRENSNAFLTRPSAFVDFAQSSQGLNWVDQSFGVGGKAVLTFGQPRELAFATAIQTDGKILIGGELHISGSGNVDMALARFNVDGTLDTTFNGNGMIRVMIPNSNDTIRDIIIQPDGKILVGGFTVWDFCLIRFNPDGSYDTFFDGDGIVRTPILLDNGQPLANTIICSLSLLPDGRILAVGDASGYIAFARYNPDGSLDNSFDGDGRKARSIDGGSTTKQAIVQPDGKIISIGWTNSGFAKFYIARFNSDGSFDQSFGSGGVVVSNLGAFSARAWACALQPDGKIIVGGTESRDLVVVRLNTDGSFDASFDGDGFVLTDFLGTSDEAFSVFVLPDGKILAGGVSNAGILQDFALARYNPDGSLDNTFGNEGKVITDINGGYDNIIEIARQSDGKIIAAGTGNPTSSNTINYDFALVRYLVTPKSLAKYDFDGDGKTDISIYRPSVGEWWHLQSSDGQNRAFQFGNSSDQIVPADFTGDGKTDVAIWRPSSGEWFVLRSEDNSYYSFPFGTSGDIPAVGDFDVDGKADAGVFRPSSGTWYISKSTGGTIIQQFGTSGDVPVIADYDRDGKSDIAIYRVAQGEWWIQRSNLGLIAFQFGSSTDKPVQGDYTGDGRADAAIWRASSGEWFVLRSEDNQNYYSFPFGVSTDIPAPGDYDGDGKFDPAVFRPSTATWFVNKSTGGYLIQSFGQSGDRPTPSAFVPF